jgi:hypothetical protein
VRGGIRLAVLILGLEAGAAVAQEQSIPEHQVKAAFVYNFTKFVTWPAGSFPSPDAPIRLGIIGDDPLASALRVVEGREAQGRKVEVLRLSPGEKAAQCHVLYVAASAQDRAEDVLGRLRGSPVLTVGDSPRFTDRGGIINFVVSGERVRIQICAARAQLRGLKISSKLLSIAHVLECGSN